MPTERSRSVSDLTTDSGQRGISRRWLLERAGQSAFALISASTLGIGELEAAGPDRGPTPAGKPGPNDHAKAVHLEPDASRKLFRVRLEMGLKGNVNVPDNALVSREKLRQLPISSQAVFDYEERYRLPAGAAQDSIVTAAERHYFEAHSSGELNRNTYRFELRPSVRGTLVRRDRLPETIYTPDEYFTHQELDLLKIPASSVGLDQLLPNQPVAVGSKYSIASESLCLALNLSAVDASAVAAEVVELNDALARIQFEGRLDGSVDGVPTTLRVLGKLTFDRQLRVCTWLALAIHETREIGKAEPGFDLAATIKLLRKPLDEPIKLPATPRRLQIDQPVPPQRILVELVSDELGMSALMDRRWRMMSDVPGSAMLRMIDQDRSIAQCDLRPLAVLGEGEQWTLEAFQQDVRRTLGDRLTQLIEGEERLGDSGLRVLRVVAHGQVEGVPIQWVMLHLSNDSGRRLLATFTMDQKSIETFTGSDIQLANALRLSTPAPAADAPTDDEADQGKSATAKADDVLANPEVADAESGRGHDELKSASDLR